MIALLLACSGTEDDTAAVAEDISFSLAFRGAVGDGDFACAPIPALGTSATTYTPLDFRLYLHDVQFTDIHGDSAPLALTQDGLWQVENVALLDFEDATGSCANGTAETNAVITGTAPDGHYDTLSFKVGVPWDLNHGDSAAAPSPLNLSTMFWSWEMGYKFARIDGTSTGQPDGAVFHLGSTGCASDENGSVTGCSNENVAEVSLDFDPRSDGVAVDLAGLFAGVDLDTNAADTMPLCMSDPTDPDCERLFGNVGLGWEDAEPVGQTMFRVE